MTSEEKLKEEYCIIAGWEKVKGYKINCEAIDGDYDYFYISEDEKDAYIEEVYFWRDAEGSNEIIHENIDDLIEELEEYDNMATFEEWRQRKEKIK